MINLDNQGTAYQSWGGLTWGTRTWEKRRGPGRCPGRALLGLRRGLPEPLVASRADG